MMQNRQKILIGSLVAMVLAWPALGWVHSTIFEPFETRAKRIADLEKSIREKEDAQLMLFRSQRSMKEFKSISLPPDPGKSKQPSALYAQRLYTKWLTDLAQLCGFESLKVSPVLAANKASSYIAVIEKIDADAHYEQLVTFLDLFYRTSLLHRVTGLHISTKISEGDPILKVSIDVEGIVLVDARPRRTLFPQTTLAERLADDATSLQISDASEFPTDPGFRVQIKGEFLKITAIDGKKWTVERAVERTRAETYASGTSVDMVQLDPKQSDRTLEEFRQMVATNLFVKPAPPYRLKLGPLAEKTFTRGRSNDFMITTLGYDTQKGKPEFSLVEGPPGLKVEKSGKVSWKPGDDVAAGKYVAKFQIRHASANDGLMTETVSIRVREPNRAPRLSTDKPGRVFLNQKWTFLPRLTSTDATTPKYSWKLGETAPRGMIIDNKTGELTWTPGDEVEIGETTVPLVATDSETPPQSTTLNLKLEIEDDAAQFTRLTGIFDFADKKQIFLTDQSTAKKMELHEGDSFSVAELAGKIKQIRGTSVTINLGTQEARWDVGQSLREVQESIKAKTSVPKGFD